MNTLLQDLKFSLRLLAKTPGFTLTAIAVLGLLLAFGLGRLCAGMLYDVSPMDPLTFTLAPAVLFVTAMVACHLPARKATRVSPLKALRSE